ncbi:MAG: ABC transporter ATP-binding protein [Anaerolineae bacterium]
MADPAVLIENMSYQYPGAPSPVLRDCCLRVDPGEFVGLIGPTGAGKTTLCLTLNGVVPQFHGGRFFGRVQVMGLDTVEHPISELARHVGMVFQDPEAQLLTTSVENEVAFALENVSLPRQAMRERIERALAAVRLEGLEKKRPHELSGGQKQRLAIAAALALEPELLVLDEPTSQLDPVGQEEVFNVVASLNQERGVTVVMASHATEMLAEYAHRIVVLAGGQILKVGAPEEVLAQVTWLQELGLRAPQVTRFYYLMQEKGADVPALPVTEEGALEGYPALRRRFRPRPLDFGETGRGKACPAPVGMGDTPSVGATPVVVPSGAGESPAPTQPARGRPRATPLLEVRDLHHVYPDGTEALRRVNLQVWPGEYLVIVGQNGAGKSTLARHLVRLLKPTSGEVRLFGQDAQQMSVGQVAQKVGFISQNPDNQIFTTRVEEEVAFALRARGMPEQEVAPRVEKALREMDLLGHRQRHPLSLPKGDRARLVVAAVLAMGPEVWIFDEPTTGQDTQGARQILDITGRLHREGKTILVITHHLYLMPDYAQRAVVMGKGDILLDAPLRQAFGAAEILGRSFLVPPQIARFAQAVGQMEGVDLPVLTEEELADCMEPAATQEVGV